MADKDTHTDTAARSGATSRSTRGEKSSPSGTEQSREWNPATEGTAPKDRARPGDF